MSEIKHYTIVTTRGLEKIQAAYHINQTVNLTHMGFGGINEYVAPTPAAIIVSNQWAKIPLERHPENGFIGGGATIENIGEYRGQWISNVGIYDEDDELILITSTPLVEVSQDASVVASYPIDIHTVLDNAASVTVVTDTSMTYATHDELSTAIKGVERKIPELANDYDIEITSTEAKVIALPQLWKALSEKAVSLTDQWKLKQKAIGSEEHIFDILSMREAGEYVSVNPKNKWDNLPPEFGNVFLANVRFIGEKAQIRVIELTNEFGVQCINSFHLGAWSGWRRKRAYKEEELYNNTEILWNDGKVLKIDIGSYDELRFYAQSPLSSANTSVVVNEITLKVSDIIDGSLSNRIVFYCLSNQSESDRLLLKYAIDDGFHFTNVGSNSSLYTGVYKIIGIKH